MINRGTETTEVIEQRIKIGKEEVREAQELKHFDKYFINDDFNVFFGDVIDFLKTKYINLKF